MGPSLGSDGKRTDLGRAVGPSFGFNGAVAWERRKAPVWAKDKADVWSASMGPSLGSDGKVNRE